MKLVICTIQDSVASAFLPPFFLPNVKMAERAFLDCIDDPNHNFHKHPHHYTLYHLGTWDDNSGEMDILSTPIFVCNGAEFDTDYVNSLSDPVEDLQETIDETSH